MSRLSRKIRSNRMLHTTMLLYVVFAFVTIFATAVNMTEDTSVVRALDYTEIEEVLPAKTASPQEDKAIMPEDESVLEDDTLYTLTPVMYTVQPGDTLWSIAKEYYNDGVMYPYIMDLNDLTSETLQIGQVLKVLPNQETLLGEISNYCNDYYNGTRSATTTVYSSAPISKDEMEYVGKFYITGYDPYCAHCCGKSNGITASGNPATIGKTIATSSQFPLGTELYIEGYGTYTVEDRGVGGSTIDIAASSHDACYDLTARNIDVYIVN